MATCLMKCTAKVSYKCRPTYRALATLAIWSRQTKTHQLVFAAIVYQKCSYKVHKSMRTQTAFVNNISWLCQFCMFVTQMRQVLNSVL